MFKQGITKKSAQKAILTAMSNRLGGLSCDVYGGGAPEQAKEPYIVIGDPIQGRDNVIATKTSEGDNVLMTVHVYTEESGMDENEDLQAEVLAAMQAPFDIGDDWNVTGHGLEPGGRTFRYSGKYAHGIVYFRFICEQLN